MTSKMNSAVPTPGNVTFALQVRIPLLQRTITPLPSYAPWPFRLSKTRFGPISMTSMFKSINGNGFSGNPLLIIRNVKSVMALTGRGRISRVTVPPPKVWIQAPFCTSQLTTDTPVSPAVQTPPPTVPPNNAKNTNRKSVNIWRSLVISILGSS